MRKSIPLILILLCTIKLALSGAGCAVSDAPMTAPTTPTTDPVALATTQPYHWTTRPSVADVVYPDFYKLWNACADVARQDGYTIDRRDYREGLLTTDPVVSQQFFEIWRHDTGSAAGILENSLDTYRRSIRFQIDKEAGGYRMTPCVIVERHAQAEQPITSDVYLRSSMVADKHPMLGTKETDRGVYLPSAYWYATGRDYAFEHDLAGQVRHKLGIR
jgi:hypothetical protein